MKDPESTIRQMIKLFDDYTEFLGLSDAEFPKDQPQLKQCEFEDKFKELICDYDGHDIGPDQCGIPDHDYCYRCGRMKVDIENTGS